MDLFIEPVRAGTPKGDKIGFSRQKYLASILIALLDIPLYEISDEVSQLFFDIANNMMLMLEFEL